MASFQLAPSSESLVPCSCQKTIQLLSCTAPNRLWQSGTSRLGSTRSVEKDVEAAQDRQKTVHLAQHDKNLDVWKLKSLLQVFSCCTVEKISVPVHVGGMHLGVLRLPIQRGSNIRGFTVLARKINCQGAYFE